MVLGAGGSSPLVHPVPVRRIAEVGGAPFFFSRPAAPLRRSRGAGPPPPRTKDSVAAHRVMRLREFPPTATGFPPPSSLRKSAPSQKISTFTEVDLRICRQYPEPVASAETDPLFPPPASGRHGPSPAEHGARRRDPEPGAEADPGTGRGRHCGERTPFPCSERGKAPFASAGPGPCAEPRKSRAAPRDTRSSMRASLPGPTLGSNRRPPGTDPSLPVNAGPWLTSAKGSSYPA